MEQELITAVEAIKTAILQSSNSLAASTELISIIPIADFKLSGINLADFPVEDFLRFLFLTILQFLAKLKIFRNATIIFIEL